MKLAHLHILQHALGADQYGQKADTVPVPEPDKHHGFHRSHFLTSLDTQDGQDCLALVDQGHMTHFGYVRSMGGNLFIVTAAGVAAMRQHSPKPPKLSRDQRRYAYFREIRDAFPDWDFRDFLRFLRDPKNRDRLPAGV